MQLDYPATTRNRDPILEVLREVLPSSGTVLEVASGSGQHVTYFSAALPHLIWQPTDIEEAALASIAAWCRDRPNVRAPVRLDVLEPWPIDAADAVIATNLIHISPWATCLALFAGAARVLPSGGALVLYGPYRVGGAHTAPSNLAFDESLRARDPAWGVRDLEAVVAAAGERGLTHERTVPMPANNLSVVFRAG